MPEFHALAREAEFLHRFRRTLVGPDDVLVFGSSDHGPGFNDMLHALDRATGEVRWAFGGRESPLDVLGPACADDAAVYVGRSNGVLYALDRRTGAPRWQLRRGRGLCAPCLHDGALAVSEAPVNTLRVDPATGAVLADAGVALHRYPPDLRAVLLPHARLLFQLSSDGTLTELTRTWPARWIADAAAHVFGAAALFVAAPDGAVRSFDLGDGGELWRSEGPADVKRLATDGRTVWACSAAGAIGALDALTGDPLWSRRIPPTAALVEHAGRLYLDQHARVAVLEGATGETVGEIALDGAPCGALAGSDGMLFVSRAAEPEIVMHAVSLARGGRGWRTAIGGYGLT
ncbi:MAG: PQQ-binding-like beta-propeller repeat protein [Planctomycetia bacterium]|nr:PQQ-binding-like beta-propeller repeat protein [Planctomycetia bacterium]